MGKDAAAFVSAVISAAAGIYVLSLTEAADVESDLTIQPGQIVIISGDVVVVSGGDGLTNAPAWGSGGFAVQQFGSLSLSRVWLAGALSVAAGGSLALSSCDLAATAAVTVDGGTATALSNGV